MSKKAKQNSQVDDDGDWDESEVEPSTQPATSTPAAKQSAPQRVTVQGALEAGQKLAAAVTRTLLHPQVEKRTSEEIAEREGRERENFHLPPQSVKHQVAAAVAAVEKRLPEVKEFTTMNYAAEPRTRHGIIKKSWLGQAYELLDEIRAMPAKTKAEKLIKFACENRIGKFIGENQNGLRAMTDSEQLAQLHAEHTREHARRKEAASRLADEIKQRRGK